MRIKSVIHIYKFIVFIGILLISACAPNASEQQLNFENLHAWCIVPFDKEKRNPEERIEMLKELGIKKYAYDWREEHLSSTAQELNLAKQNGIEVISVWMWIDDDEDSVEQLSESNQQLLNILETVGYQGEIWLGFNANYYENLSGADAIHKAVDMIGYLNQKANELSCKVAIYNHGDWIGNPLNQIKIIESIPDGNIGVIYNFHHGHEHIANFESLAKTMVPYLWHVNLNGMNKDGPQILPIGKGQHEKDMIQALLNNGYKGDFGILGHVEERDVKLVLEENLEGLHQLGIDEFWNH